MNKGLNIEHSTDWRPHLEGIDGVVRVIELDGGFWLLTNHLNNIGQRYGVRFLPCSLEVGLNDNDREALIYYHVDRLASLIQNPICDEGRSII